LVKESIKDQEADKNRGAFERIIKDAGGDPNRYKDLSSRELGRYAYSVDSATRRGRSGGDLKDAKDIQKDGDNLMKAIHKAWDGYDKAYKGGIDPDTGGAAPNRGDYVLNSGDVTLNPAYMRMSPPQKAEFQKALKSVGATGDKKALEEYLSAYFPRAGEMPASTITKEPGGESTPAGKGPKVDTGPAKGDTATIGGRTYKLGDKVTLKNGKTGTIAKGPDGKLGVKVD
jgi:hypothetical protein